MISDYNLTLILTAVGTLFAILIPIVVWFLRRDERRQLDIVLDKEVFLVNQLARNLKNFSVVIDGNPAPEQVVWVTGWIINSGNFDIGERIIEHSLKLALPDTMTWLRVDIDHSSGGVKCNCAVIDAQHIQFDWTLLRSGEYVYFDALIHCPLEEMQQLWGRNSFIEIIRPYSRIENTRTDSVIAITDLGEKYNPLKPRERHIISKSIVSCLMALFIAFTWTRTFFPFDLDDLFGDGLLSARPSIVKVIDGIPFELDVSIDRSNNVTLTLDKPSVDVSFSEEYFMDNHRDIFDKYDIEAGRISARDLSQETFFVALLGFLTCGMTWLFLYMWFPIKFLFDSKKRRTAAALYALRDKHRRSGLV